MHLIAHYRHLQKNVGSVKNKSQRNRNPSVLVLVVTCSVCHYYEGKLITERCSITLLTLSTPYASTCRTCRRKKLNVKVFTEDTEWCTNTLPDFAEGRHVMNLPEVRTCIYCGGEWIQKV